MENNRLLLIFTRNPDLGKCKTRLANKIGDRAALDIYLLLLQQTVAATTGLNADKMVCYSDRIPENDMWDPHVYLKMLQQGNSLGERMEHAFRDAFARGYGDIIIIGTDLYDLRQADLDTAFRLLEGNDYVIGPAADGGYYLLGMKTPNNTIFHNKDWGSPSVFEETVKDLQNKKLAFLPVKNDVDDYEDILDIPAFRQYVKQPKHD